MKSSPGEISVVRKKDGWCIVSDRNCSSTFDYKVDAEEAALKMKNKAKEVGANVEVLVQDGSGELRPIRESRSGHEIHSQR